MKSGEEILTLKKIIILELSNALTFVFVLGWSIVIIYTFEHLVLKVL